MSSRTLPENGFIRLPTRGYAASAAIQYNSRRPFCITGKSFVLEKATESWVEPGEQQSKKRNQFSALHIA